MRTTNPIGCGTCGRMDVRLYRNYGSVRRDEDIVCNAHLPDNCELGWWVPCIFDYSDPSPDGSIWGYTSARKADLVIWRALPDARFGPFWSPVGTWEASRDVFETACSLGDRADKLESHRRLHERDLVPDTCRHGGHDICILNDGTIRCLGCMWIEQRVLVELQRRPAAPKAASYVTVASAPAAWTSKDDGRSVLRAELESPPAPDRDDYLYVITVSRRQGGSLVERRRARPPRRGGQVVYELAMPVNTVDRILDDSSVWRHPEHCEWVTGTDQNNRLYSLEDRL